MIGARVFWNQDGITLEGRVVSDGTRWSHPSQRQDYGRQFGAADQINRGDLLVRVDGVIATRPTSEWFWVSAEKLHQVKR